MKRNVSGLTLKCDISGNMVPCLENFPVTVYPMGRRACEGQIWKKQVAAFSRWGFLIFAGPSDHIASLRHQAQCRQRPERLAPGARRRRFGGQPPPQAAALGPEMAVPLFYIAEKAMMKEGTRFRRKICGLLPWALLLSLEDVRQLAGELFFFRRRKKNQESSVKSATVWVGLFPASRRGALLLSSLKEVSKKGATLSNGWTTTWGPYPQDPRH